MPRRGFTLIEILSSIAIIAVMLAVALPFIGNYVAIAKRTADEETLAVLNDALTRYKTSGGNINSLTFGASIGNIIQKLKQPLSWAGITHQVLNPSFTIPSRSLHADGDGKNFRFTGYNTYMAPTTVTSNDSSGLLGGSLPEGIASLTHNSGAFSLNITSSSGFVAYRVDGSAPSIVSNGSFSTASGHLITFWPCDESTGGINGEITTLTASGNTLTAVNLTNLGNLIALDIGNNSLSALSLPASSSLTTLYCDQNTFNSLSVSACTTINYINLTSSSITSSSTSLNSLYNTLPTLEGNIYLGTGVADAGTIATATAKGWTVHYNSLHAGPVPSSGKGIVWHTSGVFTLTSIDTSTNFFAYQVDNNAIHTSAEGANKVSIESGSKLTFWSCPSLANSTVSGNLTILSLKSTDVTNFDFRSLSALINVNLTECYSLVEIDLSGHTTLTTINLGTSGGSAGASAVTSINISGCSGWISGYIDFDLGRLNNLQTINISGCSSRTYPLVNTGSYTGSNWTSLSISGCNAITALDIHNGKFTSTLVNQIYTDLPTHAGTVLMGGNIGGAGDNPTIATSKGWTVIGS